MRLLCLTNLAGCTSKPTAVGMLESAKLQAMGLPHGSNCIGGAMVLSSAAILALEKSVRVCRGVRCRAQKRTLDNRDEVRSTGLERKSGSSRSPTPG